MKKIIHWTNRLRHARIVSLIKGLRQPYRLKPHTYAYPFASLSRL